ncbi:MAG: hypothetical protein ACE5E1_02200 [Phycisphaerae bacterium]
MNAPDNDMTISETRKPSRALFDRWTALTLVGVGVFMFWGAGHYTVFDDEALSGRLYALPMGEMLRALWRGVDPDPPLYYILENLWVHTFGIGPIALRSLSIVFFLAALVVMRAAGEAWFDRRTGIATLVICGFHPAHLFFGFAARWYSLMFLMVAVLLWATARVWTEEGGHPKRILAWAAAAAGACYTNYFGPIVVGLLWLAVLWRARRTPAVVRRWLIAAALATALCAPWFHPFWQQLHGFQRPGVAGASFLATAARTGMALLAGNLASPEAWWVWAPLLLHLVATAALTVRSSDRARLSAYVALGCFTAGVAGRTMIDKYVMTFSGVACLWAAAVLVQGWFGSPGRPARRLAAMMAVGLAAGWIGCGINLVTGSHWSSLRWHDPFERAIRDLADDPTAPPPEAWVMTHPSARYYYELLLADRTETNGTAGTPRSVLDAMQTGRLRRLVTFETAGFARLPDWAALHAAIDAAYDLEGEPRRYLEDPNAAWKDRIDPAVRHPRWRIVVRHWRLNK